MSRLLYVSRVTVAVKLPVRFHSCLQYAEVGDVGFTMRFITSFWSVICSICVITNISCGPRIALSGVTETHLVCMDTTAGMLGGGEEIGGEEGGLQRVH